MLLRSVVAVRTAIVRSSSASFAAESAFSLPISQSSKSASFPATNTNLMASFMNLTRHFSSMVESKYYTVGITGASGLIGTAFQNQLRAQGEVNGKPVRVFTFKRGQAAEAIDAESLSDDRFTSAKSVTWNPNAGDECVDASVIQSLDALVHLSGENISTGEGLLAPLGIRPWTQSKKQEIIDSRTVTTSALASAIVQSGNKNCDFLVASGVGVYGSDFIGGECAKPAADESTDVTSTKGFLADVSRLWEASSKAASEAGNRVVQLRNGVALSRKGGALAKLYPIFYLGGGGIVGSTGQQYFPFVSNRDIARSIAHVLETPSLTGPVNLCAPGGATNYDFTKAMGTVLNRPTLLPFPAFAVSLLFGEMGEEVLLGGTQAVPKKLLDSGFQFLHPNVEDAVRSAIEEENEI